VYAPSFLAKQKGGLSAALPFATRHSLLAAIIPRFANWFMVSARFIGLRSLDLGVITRCSVAALL
jgi:hypothetical protein